jgi:hypothetical protein
MNNDWMIDTLEFAIKNNLKVKLSECCCFDSVKVIKDENTYYGIDFKGMKFEILGWMSPSIDWSERIEADERRLLAALEREAKMAPPVPKFSYSEY